MKRIALLLTFLACQAHGQVPSNTPSSIIKPGVRPAPNLTAPGLTEWSDSALRQLPKLVPDGGRRNVDEMPVARPDRSANVPMPTSRPDNAFYRSPNDPSGLVRATLDNMPIHGYDTTARRPATVRRDKPRK